MDKSVLVAMSGGVDSTVALGLLLEQGYACVGVTMKLFSDSDIYGSADFRSEKDSEIDKCGKESEISKYGERGEKACCSLNDVEDARSAAFALGVPYYVLNLSEDFHNYVIKRFIVSYESGCTPNPCIDCNRFLKFDKLLSRATALDIEYIATGHYAVIERDLISGRYLLKKAANMEKDQSYVLYSMTQEQLRRAIFPLGKMSKAEVRAIADKYGFKNAQKRESQDICFAPDGDYAGFIERYTGKTYAPGDFIDTNGNVLGRHNGLIRYTIGQRKGLRVALGRPMYVQAKNKRTNTVALCTEPELYSRALTARDINLIAVADLAKPLRVKAKARYRQPEQSAIAEQTGPDELYIEFDKPQRAIAPGQAVVLYDGDVVVGGGTIAPQD